MAILGLIGGPLVCASGIAVLLGGIQQDGLVQGAATIPEILWELSLGIYLTARGFKPSALDELMREPMPERARVSAASSESNREAYLPPQATLVT
jgi:hypothetical protein